MKKFMKFLRLTCDAIVVMLGNITIVAAALWIYQGAVTVAMLTTGWPAIVIAVWTVSLVVQYVYWTIEVITSEESDYVS